MRLAVGLILLALCSGCAATDSGADTSEIDRLTHEVRELQTKVADLTEAVESNSRLAAKVDILVSAADTAARELALEQSSILAAAAEAHDAKREVEALRLQLLAR